MNSERRRRLVRRIDMALLSTLALTVGIAAILFWYLVFRDLDEEEEVDNTPTLVAVVLSPSDVPTQLPSRTPTLTRTPLPTFTPSLTVLPFPTPQINPIPPSGLYAGQAITFSGQSQPGNTVIILDQGNALAQTTADDSGGWTIQLEDGLTEGVYALQVVAENADGMRSDAAPVRILIEELPTATASPSITPSPTITISPSPTSTMTITVTSTSTPSATFTLTEMQLPTDTSTPIVTETAIASPTSTETMVSTREATEVGVIVVTLTETPTQIPSPTESPSATPTLLPSNTVTPTSSTTLTVTSEPTVTSSVTLTSVPTETSTLSPSETISPSPQPSDTPTTTASPTEIPSNTPTVLPTNTLTATNTVSPTPTLTLTLTQTPTATSTLTPENTEIAQVPSDTPTAPSTDTPESPLLEILTPADGDAVVAGVISVRGRSPSDADIQLINGEDGVVLAEGTSSVDGQWLVDITIEEAGDVTLIAQLADDSTLQSDPITITVAPIVQPRTGIDLTPDPENEQGAIFTAFIALLITTTGFTLIFAGRLLYSMANHQQESEDSDPIE